MNLRNRSLVLCQLTSLAPGPVEEHIRIDSYVNFLTVRISPKYITGDILVMLYRYFT
jgi:hypothetical protein